MLTSWTILRESTNASYKLKKYKLVCLFLFNAFQKCILIHLVDPSSPRIHDEVLMKFTNACEVNFSVIWRYYLIIASYHNPNISFDVRSSFKINGANIVWKSNESCGINNLQIWTIWPGNDIQFSFSKNTISYQNDCSIYTRYRSGICSNHGSHLV